MDTDKVWQASVHLTSLCSCAPQTQVQHKCLTLAVKSAGYKSKKTFLMPKLSGTGRGHSRLVRRWQPMQGHIPKCTAGEPPGTLL